MFRAFIDTLFIFLLWAVLIPMICLASPIISLALIGASISKLDEKNE